MQVKLLQTLQDGTVRRIWGKKDIKLDIHAISATNRDLNANGCSQNISEKISITV